MGRCRRRRRRRRRATSETTLERRSHCRTVARCSELLQLELMRQLLPAHDTERCSHQTPNSNVMACFVMG